jgi:hypothetical protein
MATAGYHVDRGCIDSLDPTGADIQGLPAAYGNFHAIVGWGGGEMRAAQIESEGDDGDARLAAALKVFDLFFDTCMLRCTAGDDLAVCTDSQAGGLGGAFVDDFHYIDAADRAIHIESICVESGPSAAAERLLDTPTSDATTWAHVLPKAPPAMAAEAKTKARRLTPEPAVTAAAESISLTVARQGDDVVVSVAGAASRLWKARVPTLAGGVCLAVSGGTVVDAQEATVRAAAYYAAGDDSLCTPPAALAVASSDPPSASSLGGSTITILGWGFSVGAKVKFGDEYAHDVVVANPTTITCDVVPGAPGVTTLTVLDASGNAASIPFTYTDPGPPPGGVVIIAPADGEAVTAGSTITVRAEGTGALEIASAVAAGLCAAASVDVDPGAGFSSRLTIPGDAVGPYAIGLAARATTGHVVLADPVTVMVTAPGDVTLVRLDADRLTLMDFTPVKQLRLYGIYSDGKRREVTRARGATYEIDAADPRKPNFPYNGTGIATVSGTGAVTAISQGSTLCRVSFGGRKLDVVVEVAGIRPLLTLAKPGFLSWPYQGEGVTYDLVRGKLTALRAAGGSYADPSVGLICLKNDFVNVTAADVTNPPVGEGFFYLMRESRSRDYDESLAWVARSQVGRRTPQLDAAPGSCP